MNSQVTVVLPETIQEYVYAMMLVTRNCWISVNWNRRSILDFQKVTVELKALRYSK